MSLDRTQLAEMSPLTFAYIGDAVWEMYVRDRIVSELGCKMKMNDIHKKVAGLVNATFQSSMVELIAQDFLTADELDLVKRGRNCRPGHVNKNNSLAAYRQSTGFEALLGYLHLIGSEDRLNEIMDKIIEISKNV